MGRILLHLPSAGRVVPNNSPLPSTLQTPSGLAILEIQGTLNIAHGTDGPPSGHEPLAIGHLSFPLYEQSGDAKDTAWHKRVYLYIGNNQRLTGELKKLANPLALLRKRQLAKNAMQDEEELEMAEIVYYKLSFTSRPEPFGTAQTQG